MVKLTRAQRVALKQVYDRTPQHLTYKGFRKYCVGGTGGMGLKMGGLTISPIVVTWQNMFLLIEPDGYTH